MRAAAMSITRESDRAFLVTCALLFVVSAAATFIGCASMSSMPGMDMPGGWTMSMTWMRMPGQTWPDAAALFIGMWTVMMIAMMLPVLVPMLSRFRAATPAPRARTDRLTAIMAVGYFAVWATCGAAVYPLGAMAMDLAMRSAAVASCVPLATGAVVLFAGLSQFTRWKKRQLARCHESPACGDRPPSALAAPSAVAAWRHGLGLGLQCARCCAGLTAILIVVGVMDLYAMIVVTAAIAAERLAPARLRLERVVGSAVTCLGLWMIALAARN